MSDFEEELKSADIDFFSIVKFQFQLVQALRTMTATTAITVKEPRLQKTVKRKKPTAKNKKRGGMTVAQKQSKQPTSQCSAVDAELEQFTLTRKQGATEIKIGKQQ